MNLLKKIREIAITILILSIFSPSSFANEPSLFIKEITQDASSILLSSKSKEEKIQNLQKIALNSVDIKGIGLYTLGKHRNSITDDQKIKYNDLFKKYFLKSFSSRLVDYTDPKIEIKSEKKLNEKYTIVSTILVGTDKRPEVKINWRVYTKNPDKPLIRDLIIEGLSLARTQKEEFNSIIQSNEGDINALFSSLAEFINK